ncbi:MAG: response regulator [Chloroflexi bacterium]|nr:MAG: response regulator [Chloroflexota bacterium]
MATMSTILVIDDDSDIRDYLGNILKAKGFETICAENGRVGLEMVQVYRPDVIICDIAMPHLDGYDVLETLRSQPETATLPVIMLSARRERSDIRYGMELGADDYLTKPFHGREVYAAVEAQLKKQETYAREIEDTLTVLRRNIIYALPHEVRTPLMQILGFAEMLELDYKSAKPDDILRAAQVISSAGRRLERLMENYLTYAQIELIASDVDQLKALRNFIVPDAGSIIERQAVEVAQQVGREQDLRIDVVKQALQISELDLCKIVSELVHNAFKFSEPGSEVEVIAEYKDKQYVIDITDRGRGMTDEQIDQIGAYMQFDRVFFEQQGIGFGLTIAKRLTELHQGYFEIESVPNQSTCVRLSFPTSS